jgi:lipoyl(octanoyl) transferase
MAAPSQPVFRCSVQARRPLAVWLAGTIGLDAYAPLAERLAWDVSEPHGRPPTLVVCELEPVITIGRLGSRTDVLLTDEELRERRLECRFVGRGGGAVLHGPGQICVALFAALEDLGLGRHDVGGLVARLEDGIAAAVRQTGCQPQRYPGVPGIFGRSGLLAATSLAVRRGVAWHGGFVNVCPALAAHHAVCSVPAGMVATAATGRTMGSMEADLHRKVRMQDVRTAVVQHLADAFGFPRTVIQSGFPLPVVDRSRSPRETLGHVG